MSILTLEGRDSQFKLNGTALSGIVGFTPPSVGKQLRLITTIADSYPVYVSSKLDTDSDFVVDCVYDSGSATQEPLIQSLRTATNAGTAVSASQFEMLFTGGAHITGTCLPMSYDFGKIESKPDAVAIQFKFKKLQVTV